MDTSPGPPVLVIPTSPSSLAAHHAPSQEDFRSDSGHHAWDIPKGLDAKANAAHHLEYAVPRISPAAVSRQPCRKAESRGDEGASPGDHDRDGDPSSRSTASTASPAAAAASRVQHPNLASTRSTETGPEGDSHRVTRVTAVQVNEGLLEDERERELLALREEQEAIDRAVQEELARESRIVRSLGDEDLDAMIRGMQKMVHSVRIAPPRYPLRRHPEDMLDLNPAVDEEFTLDKLRSQLERFYSSVIFGLIRVGKEARRIRNWEDGGRRTKVALAIYVLAWSTGLIIFTLFAFLSVLVLIPRSRSYCFGPPSHVVRARIDTSGLSSNDADATQPISLEQKRLTVLESPAIPWGPAASERQAVAWAREVESTLISLVIPGKKGGKGGEKAEEKVQEEVNGVLVRNMKKRKDGTGTEGDADTDKEKQQQHQHRDEGKMSDKDKKGLAVEVYGKPTMQIIAGLADKWERIGNAISPTPPFVKPSRLRLFCLVLLPALALGLLVTPKMVSRALGFGIGMAVFGKPVIDPVIAELDKRIPHWLQRLILEHNILADVPTNPQLVIRLLRQAEHQNHPIPFAVPLKENDTDGITGSADLQDEDSGKRAKMSAMEKKMVQGTRTKARRSWDRLGTWKEESFAWLSGRKKVDYEGKAKSIMVKLHVSPDTTPAAALLRKLPDGSDDPYDSLGGPSRFYVNHAKHGPGHIIIHPPVLSSQGDIQMLTPARITFTTIRQVASGRNVSIDPTAQTGNTGTGSRTDLTISIDDIIAMEKTGLGKVARLAVSWALDVDGAGGTGLDLTIIRRDLQTGAKDRQGVAELVRLTSIVRRDELFERLLTVGDQRWELL